MFSINAQDKSPLYQQIMDQLILFVANGLLQPGDKLPSIREMASDLGINPNTVARAYSELERANVIETYPKKGAFIKEQDMGTRIEEKAYKDFLDLVNRYIQMGMDKTKLFQIVEEVISDATY